MNYLHLGDCFDVLSKEIPDESVDLIYIDPPFNSKRNYNIFFDDAEIQAQRVAFEDTWSLRNTQDSLALLERFKTEKVHKLLMTYAEVAPAAFPYLVMMALRIVELHRVLKSVGSFYLHCDPTMSHYLKNVCDVIFGYENFRNEICWCYRKWSTKANQFARNHDVILFYSKSADNIFNIQYVEPGAGTLKRWKGKKHKRVMINGEEKTIEVDEPIETPAPDWWDIGILNANAKERLGYPTQKPKALLERIIKASSNKGDIVLDAFCGCGTTIDAAESLNRRWMGMDISPVAISIIKKRLTDTYDKTLSKYQVRGVPTDEKTALKLWKYNPFAFQDWWVTECGAFSTTFGTKGADKGIDGIAKYRVAENQTVKAAFQVKGGGVQSKDIDALLGAMSKHKCGLGVFLSVEEPSKPMLETVISSGSVEVPGFRYPKLQYLTIKDFFTGKKLKLPDANITFESARFKGKELHQQLDLNK